MNFHDVINAVVPLQSRESLESALASASPSLVPILRAALETREGSEEWETAEGAIAEYRS